MINVELYDRVRLEISHYLRLDSFSSTANENRSEQSALYAFNSKKTVLQIKENRRRLKFTCRMYCHRVKTNKGRYPLHIIVLLGVLGLTTRFWLRSLVELNSWGGYSTYIPGTLWTGLAVPGGLSSTGPAPRRLWVAPNSLCAGCDESCVGPCTSEMRKRYGKSCLALG